MLERLDAALGGWLDRTLPAVDVVPPFAAFICWSGLLFDLAIPFALLFGGPRLRWGVALPAATTFNALNKAWFHLDRAAGEAFVSHDFARADAVARLSTGTEC